MTKFELSEVLKNRMPDVVIINIMITILALSNCGTKEVRITNINELCNKPAIIGKAENTKPKQIENKETKKLFDKN